MKIIPETSSLVVVTDGVARPLLDIPPLTFRESFRRTLLVKLEMAKNLPDGIYKYTIEWKLIQGVKWSLHKVL